MTARTFTPGPWTLCRLHMDGRTASFHVTAAPHGSLDPVVESNPKTFRDSAELEGNGRLIAAAPDMLAALEMCQEALDNLDTISLPREEIAAAIALAKGER